MDNLMPLVSVILPVHNSIYVEEALNSVKDQTYKNIEIIVIDDGSTDNTPDIISEFNGIQVIKTANRGVAEARNEGLRSCRGEYISFIDSDDIWNKEKTSMQVDFLLGDPGYDVVYGRFSNFFQENSNPPLWIDKKKFLDRDTGKMISLVTLMIRNNMIREIGFFDEKLRTGSDLDWIIKMKECSRIYFDDHEVMRRRLHSSNLTYESISGGTNLVKLLKSSLDRKRSVKG